MKRSITYITEMERIETRPYEVRMVRRQSIFMHGFQVCGSVQPLTNQMTFVTFKISITITKIYFQQELEYKMHLILNYAYAY